MLLIFYKRVWLKSTYEMYIYTPYIHHEIYREMVLLGFILYYRTNFFRHFLCVRVYIFYVLLYMCVLLFVCVVV